MFEDLSHYFILQMLSKDSKKVTPEIYEKLSESVKSKMKVGDIPVAYFVQTKMHKENEVIECRLEFTSLQNAIEEVTNLKYVEFRKDIPVFEV